MALSDRDLAEIERRIGQGTSTQLMDILTRQLPLLLDRDNVARVLLFDVPRLLAEVRTLQSILNQRTEGFLDGEPIVATGGNMLPDSPPESVGPQPVSASPDVPSVDPRGAESHPVAGVAAPERQRAPRAKRTRDTRPPTRDPLPMEPIGGRDGGAPPGRG